MSKLLTLNQLLSGQNATICDLNSGWNFLSKQCAALGLTPGSRIRVLRQARGKGPMQVKSQGSYYAIRAEEAAGIYVQLHEEGPATA